MEKSIATRAAACATVAAVLAASPCPAADRRPNVIFILADDLGYGDVGWAERPRPGTAGTRISTPNLERLAREGAILTSHYCAAPVCAPSRASLLTGRMQGRCSLSDNCFEMPFAEKETLGSVMRKAGYATWAVGKWGIAGGGESGRPVSSHPLDRGFDYFYGFLDHLAGHTYYHYDGKIRRAFMGITENRTNATASAAGIYSTDLFAAKAKQLVSEHAAKSPETPFFLFLAVNAVHGSGQSDATLADKTPLHVPGRPYPARGVSWPLAPEPRKARNTWIHPDYRKLPPKAARYATAIRRLDDAVGDIASELKRLGLDRDTMIIFTSDNGPADEYGADPRFFDSNGPFDGFKRDVFEGGMRVPAFVRWPGGVSPGQTDDSPSQFHDWMATLADVAGLPPAKALSPECDGVSLLPRWKSPGRRRATGAAESTIYSQYEFSGGGGTQAFKEFAARKKPVRGFQQMARSGDYTAVRTCMRGAGGEVRPGNARTRLYNVKDDPFQGRDLAHEPEHAAKLAELEAFLDKMLKKR